MTNFLDRSKISSLFFQILLKKHHIIVLSSFFEFFLKEKYSFKNVHCVYNSVDIEEYENYEHIEFDKKIFRDEQTNKTKVLFFGLICQRKGVHDIIKIIPQITSKHPDALFIFAGTSGDFTKKLENFIAQSKITNNILYLKNVSDRIKVQLFLQSDIFLLPTYSEGLPIALLEAMAFGLPVVTTPVGAIPEVIEDGKNGFLVDPGDTKALSERIVALIENPVLWETMRKNNTQRINAEFTQEKMIEKIDRIYQESLYSA